MRKNQAFPRRVRLTLVLTAAIVGTLPLAGDARAAHPADASIAKTLGCHEFTGGEKERQALKDAIEAVVREFNVFIRPIVRSRLKASNPLIERLCFERTRHELSISLDGRRYTAPIDGGRVTVTGITGDKLQLHYRVTDTEVRQVFQNDDAARINAFRSTKDSRLQMQVRVRSERLPKELAYRLTYRRANE